MQNRVFTAAVFVATTLTGLTGATYETGCP